ncbi:hypothetical protein N868_09050 [Cellulomonas carbonis T26]|uniref:DUF1918 domain-containing protein n=1 Tax=Cellulomonas carbonis T26 TaxID=947969 RepID=A0A0A0BUU1_9CELL|nr:hypothetical protein N868_09050 [Cellulomonas carbonis T26]
MGDRYVQASSVVDGPVRDGEVVELRHPDGSPPYVIRWSDTGERTLVFPGPDAHVEHAGGPATGVAGGGDDEGGTRPAGPAVTWRVQVTVSHDGRDTVAQAVLSGAPERVDSVGRSRRDPHDPSLPRIGEEVAVARALRHLADRLVDAAEDDIEQSTGRPAHVHS